MTPNPYLTQPNAPEPTCDTCGGEDHDPACPEMHRCPECHALPGECDSQCFRAAEARAERSAERNAELVGELVAIARGAL